MTASFLFSIGVAPVFALSADLVVGAVPLEKAGSAAAIAETSSELGGALGIAMLGSAFAAFYRHRLDGAMPAGLQDVVAARLRDGISSAIATLDGVEPLHRPGLREAVIEAFTGAFAAVALICLALAATAALAARSLRA